MLTIYVMYVTMSQLFIALYLCRWWRVRLRPSFCCCGTFTALYNTEAILDHLKSRLEYRPTFLVTRQCEHTYCDQILVDFGFRVKGRQR